MKINKKKIQKKMQYLLTNPSHLIDPSLLDFEDDKDETNEEKKEDVNPSIQTSTKIEQHHHLKIEKPLDILRVQNLKEREQEFKKFAQKWYEDQPVFMKRGKERFDALVEYDTKENKITWDGKILPGTSQWKSNQENMTNDKKPKVVLVLMVKNESAIIVRMLETIKDDIDGFIILDTGSTDNTKELMWDFLTTKLNKKGSIFISPWFDFSTNRTITVQLAYNQGDWLLLMDADYRLVKENNSKENSTKNCAINWRDQLPPINLAPFDGWLMLETDGDLAYSRPHLVLGNRRWFYSQRTHEYLSLSKHNEANLTKNPQIDDKFKYLKIDHVGDGGSKMDKHPRDIVLLLMDLLDNDKNERSYFYLGNTLHAIGMNSWSLRCYKKCINFDRWNEENYYASKMAGNCLFQLKTSQERQIALLVHAQTINPDRLEYITEYIQYVRNNKELWPLFSHSLSCLGSFFTHNVYPERQKLFITRWIHDVGFWQELALSCFYNPVYFELGLFTSHKLCDKLKTMSEVSKGYKENAEKIKDSYLKRVGDWERHGITISPQIRAALLNDAHLNYKEHRWSKAKDIYESILHPVILRSNISEQFWPTTEEEKIKNAKSVKDICSSLHTLTFHKIHRLSAWQSTRFINPMLKSTELDKDKALACYYMGMCQLNTDWDSMQNRLLSSFHFIDALKFWSEHAPSLNQLLTLTLCVPSHLTRAIMYLTRMVLLSTSAIQSMPLLQKSKEIIDRKVEKSQMVMFYKPHEMSFLVLPRMECLYQKNRKEMELQNKIWKALSNRTRCQENLFSHPSYSFLYVGF